MKPRYFKYLDRPLKLRQFDFFLVFQCSSALAHNSASKCLYFYIGSNQQQYSTAVNITKFHCSGPPRPPRQPRFGPIWKNWSKNFGIEYWTLPSSTLPWRPCSWNRTELLVWPEQPNGLNNYFDKNATCGFHPSLCDCYWKESFMLQMIVSRCHFFRYLVENSH